MPDVGSSRVQEIPTYTGARDSSRIVYNARSKIELLLPPQYSTDQCEQTPTHNHVLTSYTLSNVAFCVSCSGFPKGTMHHYKCIIPPASYSPLPLIIIVPSIPLIPVQPITLSYPTHQWSQPFSRGQLCLVNPRDLRPLRLVVAAPSGSPLLTTTMNMLMTLLTALNLTSLTLCD